MAKAKKFETSSEHLISLREQYDSYVDLFKFYVDTILKTTIWYFTVTGAILAFHFGDKNPATETTIHAVLLPALFSIVLATIFFGSSRAAITMQQDLDRIRLDLGLEGAPHVRVLRWTLLLFGITFLLVGAALSGYWLSVAFQN